MAAVGARTLALLFGAGYSGSYIYNNQEKARNIATALLNATNPPQKGNTVQSSRAEPNNTELNVLTQQVDRLTREVSRNRTDPVVIMGPSGYKGSLATISDVFNLLGWAVVAFSLGGVVYYVAYRKRLRLTDLAWVSQSTFNGTISAMRKGISQVSDTVGAVRQDLGKRLGMLKGQVDEVRDTLSKQIEEEVGTVQRGVSEVGDDVANVKDVLGNVKSRIDELDTKLEYATTGILALVRAVSSVGPERVQPGTPFHELRQLATFAEKGGESGNGMLRHRISIGLGGLLPQKENGDVEKNKRRSLDMGSPSFQVS